MTQCGRHCTRYPPHSALLCTATTPPFSLQLVLCSTEPLFTRRHTIHILPALPASVLQTSNFVQALSILTPMKKDHVPFRQNILNRCASINKATDAQYQQHAAPSHRPGTHTHHTIHIYIPSRHTHTHHRPHIHTTPSTHTYHSGTHTHGSRSTVRWVRTYTGMPSHMPPTQPATHTHID